MGIQVRKACLEMEGSLVQLGWVGSHLKLEGILEKFGGILVLEGIQEKLEDALERL